MTNVVGILVIVLIMTQVNVADAVRRLRSGLPEVSAAEFAQLQGEAGVVAREIELLSDPGEAPDPAELDDARARAGVLAVELEEARAGEQTLRQLRQLVAERTAAAEAATEARREREEMLAGLLDRSAKLETAAARPPARVRMPDPRPAREDAERVVMACLGERVYLIDPAGLAEVAKRALEGGGRRLIHSVEGSGDKRRTIYKRAESTAHIGKGKTGDPQATVELHTRPNAPWGGLHITPRPDGGEPISAVSANPDNPVRQRMQKAFLDRDYIYFHVFPDAFETYLEARRLAEVEHSCPVGWEFIGTGGRIWAGLPGVRFEHTPPPPKPPGEQPKPKPNPPRPNVLD